MDDVAPPIPFHVYYIFLLRTLYQPAQRGSRWLRWLHCRH